MNTRRKDQTCVEIVNNRPCDGELIIKDGFVICLSCNFKQEDKRKRLVDGLNNWKEQG